MSQLSTPNSTEPAIDPAGLVHIATLTEALRQIAEGCAGNSGRCDDCDSAARVAATALAGGPEPLTVGVVGCAGDPGCFLPDGHPGDHSPASPRSREP